MKTNPLVYVPTPLPEDGVLNISPSKFSTFVHKPFNWYRTEILGEESFSHNTSSVLGTCVHYCADRVAKNEDVDISIIEEYVKSLEVHPDYDPNIVLENYREMAETLVNDYVLENMTSIFESESLHQAKLDHGYYAGGTVDALQGNKADTMITDYKTYNSKTKPKAIPEGYRYQLLVYAWILRQNGYIPNRIRLVYVNRPIEGEISEKTGKRMKSYPSEVTVLTETLTPEDFDFIESLLFLAVDTCRASEQHPHLRHIIWHDPRLKVEI